MTKREPKLYGVFDYGDQKAATRIRAKSRREAAKEYFATLGITEFTKDEKQVDRTMTFYTSACGRAIRVL